MENNSVKYISWANRNKKRIAKQVTDIAMYPKEERPTSVFMAGSPGAGKTESAKALIETLGSQVIHIDPDIYRNYFDDYTGNNSHLFQGAVSIISEKVHDLALRNNQSFVFDSTGSNYEKMKKNINRSINKKRKCTILYIYQEPLQAWDFVKKREKKEGRKVRKEDFIEHYFGARDSVNKLKEYFGNKISVDLIVKNIDKRKNYYKDNVLNIDSHIKEKYTEAQLIDELL